MSTKRENKIIAETLNKIQRRYNTAYKSLISRIPEILESYYSKEDGFFKTQEIINQVLQPINEFSQLQDYDSFYLSVYRDAIRQSKFDFNFQYNFSQVDQRALETFKSPQNWFTSKYQTLTDQAQTLKEMEELWKSGESIDNATKKLNDILARSNNRIGSYTKTTLITNNTRVRTISDLNNFSENGITKYKYNAVIDNVTTDTCRELNGKTYSIKKALDFQKKTDEDVNKIIQDGQRKDLPSWKIYNKTVEYLQKNDAFANETGTEKRPWQSTVILRTANPQKQGKKTVKSYKNLSSVPGNRIPRPPLHYNCRSRLEPIL